jgi:hypothetical protein
MDEVMKRLAILIAIACAGAASADRVQAQGASQDAAVSQPRLPHSSQSTLVSPIGHRQPRHGELSPAIVDNSAGAQIAPEDAEMERRMKGICRGC